VSTAVSSDLVRNDDDLCTGRKVHQFCSIMITLGVTLIRRHDLRSSAMDTCEEPAKPKKVKAELGGGSARTFFRIIIYKLLYYYYYMFITLMAHSLFSTATGPRRMALTVNRVHNIYQRRIRIRTGAHTRSLATTSHIVGIANVSVSLSSSGNRSINMQHH